MTVTVRPTENNIQVSVGTLEKGNSNQKKRGHKFLTRDDAEEYMKTMLEKQRKSHESDSSNSD